MRALEGFTARNLRKVIFSRNYHHSHVMDFKNNILSNQISKSNLHKIFHTIDGSFLSWSFQPSSTCPWVEAFLSLDGSRFSRFEDFLILMFPPPTFYEHSTFLCPIKYQTCQLSNSVKHKTIKPWVWDKRTSIEARSRLHTTHSLSRRCLIYLCC